MLAKVFCLDPGKLVFVDESGFHIEPVPTPTLTAGQIVVVDNHHIHKGDKVAELLALKGCSLLFLLPYSPDLNPIEKALSKVKTLVKTFVKASQARAWDALDQALAAALKTISLQDILGCFGHSGHNLRYQCLRKLL